MDKILVDKTEEAIPGASYEIIVDVYGKYDVSHIKTVIRAIRAGEGLVNLQPFHRMTGHWNIKDITAHSGIWKDMIPFVNTGPSEKWQLRIIAEKTETGTPIHITVGVILALIIIFVGVVGWQAYRIKDVAETVLNPVVVVGVVIIFALIYGGKLRGPS